MFSLERKLLKTTFSYKLDSHNKNNKKKVEWEHPRKEDSLQEGLKQLFITNYCVHLDADRTQTK